MAAQMTVAEQLVDIGTTGMAVVTGSVTTLIDASIPISVGARLKADFDNTGNIYIGWKNDITPGTNNKSGYKLSPGDEIPLPASNLSKIYAVSDTGSQKLYWFVY